MSARLSIAFALLALGTTMCASSGCPNIISRQQWRAKPSRTNSRLSENPAPYVVIHHSEGPNCNSLTDCEARVAAIQNYHMNTKKWKDIGYNFLVGGDGNVYEGRGWGKWGSHHPSFNSKSIGICVMGNFMHSKPSRVQLEAVKDLIQCGVSQGDIATSYHLIGHRQGRQTDCPGDALYNEIKTWPNYDSSVV